MNSTNIIFQVPEEAFVDFSVNVYSCLGFGFGCVFWCIVLWLIFGRR